MLIWGQRWGCRTFRGGDVAGRGSSWMWIVVGHSLVPLANRDSASDPPRCEKATLQPPDSCHNGPVPLVSMCQNKFFLPSNKGAYCLFSSCGLGQQKVMDMCPSSEMLSLCQWVPRGSAVVICGIHITRSITCRRRVGGATAPSPNLTVHSH